VGAKIAIFRETAAKFGQKQNANFEVTYHKWTISFTNFAFSKLLPQKGSKNQKYLSWFKPASQPQKAISRKSFKPWLRGLIMMIDDLRNANDVGVILRVKVKQVKTTIIEIIISRRITNRDGDSIVPDV